MNSGRFELFTDCESLDSELSNDVKHIEIIIHLLPSVVCISNSLGPFVI